MRSLSATLMKRYATSRRGFTAVVSIFALVGISLGVAALIVVMCVMAGFRAELLDRILGVSGHGIVFTNLYTNEEISAVETNMLAVDGVGAVIPYLQGQVMVLNGENTAGAIFRGMDVSAIPAALTSGNDAALLEQPNQLALGARMARNLGVDVGDGLTMLSSQGAYTPFGFVPQIVQARVAFVFETGSSLYDQGLIVMSRDFAKRILRTTQEATALELRVANPADIHALAPALHDVIMTAVPAKPVQLQTWQDMNRAFFQALQTERLVMFIILSLIIVVAAFNIITGQIMLVMDKTHDIAILRTMGATRGRILKIFLCNGVLLGGFGTLLGFLLGMAFVLNLPEITAFLEHVLGVKLFSGDVYPVDTIPSRVVWPDIFAVLGMSFILTVLASLYPALRAARMKPVEGLQA